MGSDGVSAAAAGRLRIGGDLEVNRLGFGAMRLTGKGIWGDPHDLEAARAVLRRTLELDVNLIDTADSYGPDVSESLLASALHPYPEGLVIATKGGLTRPGPHRWERAGSPAHLRAACEGSLERLRLERIDLYQLHAPDPKVPYEDSVGTLAELQREGKIRHIGVSNVNSEQLARARRVAEIVSVQNRFSIGDRAASDVIDVCARDGLAFFSWAPLEAGKAATRRGALERIAREKGATTAQVALGWLLRQSPAILPIPGTSSIAHLEQNVAAAGLELSDAELETLSSIRPRSPAITKWHGRVKRLGRRAQDAVRRPS